MLTKILAYFGELLKMIGERVCEKMKLRACAQGNRWQNAKEKDDKFSVIKNRAE
jgi:hypothetical protein